MSTSPPKPRTAANLATAVGLLAFCSLGIWQVARHFETAALDRDLDVRIAETGALDADALHQTEDPEWFRARLDGTYEQGEQWFAAAIEAQRKPGYHVLRGFRTTAGDHLLVLRGWVDVDRREALVGARETAVVSGRVVALRGDPERTPGVRPDGTETWPDGSSAAIAARVGGDLRPWLLVADEVGPGWHAPPRPQRPRRPHVGYALTWFGIAGALLAMWWVGRSRQA